MQQLCQPGSNDNLPRVFKVVSLKFQCKQESSYWLLAAVTSKLDIPVLKKAVDEKLVELADGGKLLMASLLDGGALKW